jgi:cysteine desulfurase/selenocysteine lyase
MMKNIRGDFPILKQGIIYLDSAATSQKPQAVIDAMNHFYAHEYATVHRGVYSLSANATQKYNQVREKIAQFINAERVDEIVFTKGTTDSINLVAQTYPIGKGDEIIISEMEHHSNIVPWQMLCERTGAILKIIPVNDRAELDLEIYQSLLNSRTKLVSIAHVANSTGTINPIETIIKMAHAHGAKVLIDAAQSAAHLPIDVQRLDADFLAFSGHKMFGPTGIGVLYGKYEFLEKMPPLQGGGDMIELVTLEKTTYAKPPLRFEAGTPSIAQVMGLGAAVDYIEQIGLENIAAIEHQLLEYATAKLLEIPDLRIIGTAERKAGIISFCVEGVHHLDLAVFLDLEGIAIRSGHHCAQPLMKRFCVPGTNRISFAPFNTFEEIDTLVSALQSTLKVLS